MRTELKNKISPPDPAHVKEFSLGKNSNANVPSSNPIDFKQLLLRSNKALKEKREAESNGDLSNAKNYQDFLNTLNKQTAQENLPRNSLDKNDFLNLFITQIQNQDPLNPKDGTEMASQLAQFNSLEQMMNMNKSLEQLGQKTDQGHSMNYINYLDKEVAVTNGKMALKDGALTNNIFTIKTPVNSSILTVRDSMGNIVASLDMGSKNPGEYKIEWDGKDEKGEKIPDGIYKVSLVGKGSGNSEIDIPITTRLKINGVNYKDKQSSFHTNVGTISFDEIEEIGSKGYYKNPAKSMQPLDSSPPVSTSKNISQISPKNTAANKPQSIQEDVPKLLSNNNPTKTKNNEANQKNTDQNFYPEINSPFTSMQGYQSSQQDDRPVGKKIEVKS